MTSWWESTSWGRPVVSLVLLTTGFSKLKENDKTPVEKEEEQMAETAQKAPKLISSVSPWGIEADHPRNCDLLIQCVPGVRLRSMITTKPIYNPQTGNMIVPPNQASFLAQFPRIPGMQLHVNPAKLKVKVYDPLVDDPELCDKIKRAMEQATHTSNNAKIKGVPTREETVDEHMMKSLVREMKWLVDAGDARVVQGSLPDMEEIDELPGNYLLNPGSRVFNTQPRFEKDFNDWVEQLTKAGG